MILNNEEYFTNRKIVQIQRREQEIEVIPFQWTIKIFLDQSVIDFLKLKFPKIIYQL